MINFEVAKQIEKQKEIYNHFFMPTIIVNKELNFFWVNAALVKDPVLKNISILNIMHYENGKIKNLENQFAGEKSILEKAVCSKGAEVYDAEILPIVVEEEVKAYIIILLKQSSSFNGNVSINDDKLINISNDIRQSISKIFAATDTLWKRSDIGFKDENKPYLDKINIASYKILRLNSNLNTYIELSNGREVSLELTDIADWFAGIELVVKELTKDTEIEVEVQVKSKKLFAQVDPELLEIAVCNIIHNAIYYSEGKNKITICLEEENDNLNIAISDEGTGFGDKEQFDVNIFKPEAGIGLKLVRKIIDAHGGKVKINTEYKKGTRLQMNIPTNALIEIARFSNENAEKELDNKYSTIYVGLTSAIEMPYVKEK